MGTFFEELGKKLSQTGQEAIEKTKQFTEISKLTAKLLDEEEQLEKLYANLGRTYYQINEKNPEAIYQDIFRAIEGSLENIKYQQKIINELKGLKTCESCHKEVAEEATFCSHCGYQLSSKEERQVYRVCTHCGTVSTGEEAECLTCQTPF